MSNDNILLYLYVHSDSMLYTRCVSNWRIGSFGTWKCKLLKSSDNESILLSTFDKKC